jgi:hypothetical protein
LPPSLTDHLEPLVTPDPPKVPNGNGHGNGNGAIPKPDEPFSLERFRTKHDVAIASVETLLAPMPHGRIAHAKDFVRLHPDPAYWSPEMCFVKGQKKDTLHLIDEELAIYLPSGQVLRYRLVLASKPHDIFFLCEVPTRNLDNMWNMTNLQACESAKTLWTMVTSRKEEGVENYKISRAKDADAFPDPKWPLQSLTALIESNFAGRIIQNDQHPALLRLIGARQSMQGAISRRLSFAISNTKWQTASTDSSPATCRRCFAWSRTCWIVTSSTCGRYGCGAASLAPRRLLTSERIPCSAPIARGRS